ncbi:MAG: dTDP-4-dehydrorhamnose 3,5-epimerase [Bacteroidota bacterium]
MLIFISFAHYIHIMLTVEKTAIEGPLILKPKIFYDERGYFYEPYNRLRFVEAGVNQEFVQDNQSLSQKGAVRGLHFQAPPFDQGKLVRVVSGAVLDVVVDIRKDSPTYGKHIAIELSAENFIQFWVPPGFAHGFATLRDDTIFQYKCTNYYNKSSEGGIRWNDPELAIKWGIADAIISEKDAALPMFNQFISPF